MRASTQEKRTRIIEVVTELFIEQGYKDTALDQVVAICGGSKQTLYRYFTNKEGLFVEVLKHNTKTTLESAFQLSDKQHQPVRQTLEEFAMEYLKGICSNPILGLYRIISADFNKHESVPHQFWFNGPVSIRQHLIEYLKSDLVLSQLKCDDVDLACDQLLGLIKLDYQNMALIGLGLPDDSILEKHCRQAVSAFLTLYSK
ncbi:TetR/AcrR family transcriptional regulator [Vibrio fluminensis]|uniref:TetR/AcrR family transcriptional regulator n=1 Tax=Vibrio fluminensis TaxID=2783614 RepID=UPI001886AE01|nr:TetR/AcrR family transcriptional regulator [Vibrio fluminensis]